MNLNERELSKLKYDKTKITVTLIPVIKNGKLTFDFRESVNRHFAFNDFGNFIIPCFIVKHKVANGVFSDVFTYEEDTVSGDYDTYNIIPKRIMKTSLNCFFRAKSRYHAFEGYFDNLFSANSAYMRQLVPELIGRILPFERVTDEKLIHEIENKDFTEYGYDDFDE